LQTDATYMREAARRSLAGPTWIHGALHTQVKRGDLEGMLSARMNMAAKCNNARAILALHAFGAYPNTVENIVKGQGPIDIACRLGNVNAVRTLVAIGAAPSEWIYIHIARYFDDQKGAQILRALFMTTPPIDAHAPHCPNLNSVELILQEAAMAATAERVASRVNTVGENGMTALDTAEMAGKWEVAELLRCHGGTNAKEL